jgi:hypothetical protein
MLPGAAQGSSAALLSPPQCQAALGTMHHTFASLDDCPIAAYKRYFSATGTLEVGF